MTLNYFEVSGSTGELGVGAADLFHVFQRKEEKFQNFSQRKAQWGNGEVEFKFFNLFQSSRSVQ